MNLISKTSGLSKFCQTTTKSVGSSCKPSPRPLAATSEVLFPKPSDRYKTSNSLASTLSGGRIVSKSLAVGVCGGTPQIRCAHTDVKIPDFGDVRNKMVKDPNQSTRDNFHNRNAFAYVSLVVGGMAVTYTSKVIVNGLLSTWMPGANVLALASIEIDLGKIPEGKNAVFKWRGRPVFVRHRTAAEIEKESQVDVASLRDPQNDSERVKKPEWLVLIGVCTHLGCIPIANAGDYGGYFCPCHGSHYDASGRIRKGPAPANLEIPPYEFASDSLLVVG